MDLIFSQNLEDLQYLSTIDFILLVYSTVAVFSFILFFICQSFKASSALSYKTPRRHSAVSKTPRKLTQRCHWHRGVRKRQMVPSEKRFCITTCCTWTNKISEPTEEVTAHLGPFKPDKFCCVDSTLCTALYKQTNFGKLILIILT